MSPRISKITANGFRGAVQQVGIDFRPSGSGRPVSLILSGDNGSGKSTLVDALEYSLQGRIQRRQSLTDPDRPLAISLGYDRAVVQAELSDGRAVERHVYRDEDGKLRRSDHTADHAFAVAPFVLRRSDILQFWDTPEHRRQTVFIDYNLAEGDQVLSESDQVRVARLESERAKVKEERRKVHSRLAIHMGVDATSLPFTGKDLDDFVRDKVYGGFNRKQRNLMQYKGKRINADRNAQALIQEMKQHSERAAKLQNEIRELNKVARTSSVERTRAIQELFGTANDWLTNAFRRVSTLRDRVTRIAVETSGHTKVTLEITAHLDSGHSVKPLRFFSEANLDLLSLLVFLSVAKAASERGQAKVLVLDDVLQSVDASIRIRVAEYILDEFSDWQLIFTVHDRLWQEQLVNMFRRASHPFMTADILRYEPNCGPVITGADWGTDEYLRLALTRGEILSVCAHAGLLLERVCQNLSWSLPISVTRRSGDKYTLGDLWPGIRKKLWKTNLRETVEDVDRWLHLRNLVGAHFNEWAQALSQQEAQELGNATLTLFDGAWCRSCYRWVEQVGDRWSCRCEATYITPVQG